MSTILSCIIEAMAETPVFVAQVFCFVKLKVVLDTVHIFVRSSLFVWLVLADPSHAIFAFSVAQVGSSISFLIGYYAYFWYYIGRMKVPKAKRDESNGKLLKDKANDTDESIPFNSIVEFLPGCLSNPVNFNIFSGRITWTQIKRFCVQLQGTIFNEELKTLVWSFFTQGLLKQLLTEGEKFVMSMSPILTFHQQATYDIVNNLGSLFARFVFRPIEENSYFYFTQTISRDVPLAKQKRVSMKMRFFVSSTTHIEIVHSASTG